jgi:type I restriction enzyme, R subunit
MNEAETRAEHIDPALKAVGWGVVDGSRIRRNYAISPGRIEGQGRRGMPLFADYVLEYRNTKLAVVEAKAWDEELTEGVAQAKNYAAKLAIRFTYASNGQGIYGVDMETGKEGEFPVYPTPDELWNLTFAKANAWRDRFAAIPSPDKSGTWSIRFYQEISVNRILEAIIGGPRPRAPSPRYGDWKDIHRIPDCLEALQRTLEPDRLEKGRGAYPPSTRSLPCRPQ